MEIQSMNAFLFSVFFIVAGLFMMFFYKSWLQYFFGRMREKGLTGWAPMERVYLSSSSVWFWRILGLFVLLGGALGIWLGTGHAIPSVTG